MQLKDYQTAALEALREFLETSRETQQPQQAFDQVIQSLQLGRYQSSYRPLKEMEHIPYACIRIPTGGGKTILGAHTVKLASNSYLERDFPVALWLVPSNTIRQQTLEAVKNPAHPYRQVLDDEFEGRVRVFDISEFTQIRPNDISESACIVVSTIQTLRVNNTEGRKVYAHNEHLEPHFARLPSLDNNPKLEKDANGKAKFSFANLLNLHNPLMIVDEAHNAVTGLSRDMQKRINPACIVEFTATPQARSNVLFSVSASALKQAEMIKLPIVLTAHTTWQSSVHDAITERERLTQEAANESAYIRPIVLFQAQNKDQEVTAEVLKQHLIDNEQIPEHKIAVVTGDTREIDGVNLLDPKCPIEYVITVKALKEGWDCSFAYVFCSVANIKSSTDVEQLLGRVLRMPYAKRRRSMELNKAYAHVCEPNFYQAALDLKDKLVDMGFEAEEVDENILSPQLDLDSDDEHQVVPEVELEVEDNSDSEAIRNIVAGLTGKASVTPTESGKLKITITQPLTDEEESSLLNATPATVKAQLQKSLTLQKKTKDRLDSPARKGKEFKVPQLCLMVQGELEFVEPELVLYIGGWNILDIQDSTLLTLSEFSAKERILSTQHDIIEGKYVYSQVDSAERQSQLSGLVAEWDEKVLVRWLDRQCRQQDISQPLLIEYLRKIVESQIQGGVPLDALVRAKYRLAKAIKKKIKDCRNLAKEQNYQQLLFESSDDVVVDSNSEFNFQFDKNSYPATRFYTGSYQFQKHFYGNHRVGELKNAGEEFQCAMLIDTLDEVEYWVRNLESRPKTSFKLATATGWFYPDFVAKLKDGRIFIVEYKGDHLTQLDDTKHKAMIGDLWENKSNGQGLFLMAEHHKNGISLIDQLRQKIES